jgi:hypothetical protein
MNLLPVLQDGEIISDMDWPEMTSLDGIVQQPFGARRISVPIAQSSTRPGLSATRK